MNCTQAWCVVYVVKKVAWTFSCMHDYSLLVEGIPEYSVTVLVGSQWKLFKPEPSHSDKYCIAKIFQGIKI